MKKIKEEPKKDLIKELIKKPKNFVQKKHTYSKSTLKKR